MNGKITMSRRGRTGRTSGTFGVSSLPGMAVVISSVMGVLVPAVASSRRLASDEPTRRRLRKASTAENAHPGVLVPAAPGGSRRLACSCGILPLDGDHGRPPAPVLEARDGHGEQPPHQAGLRLAHVDGYVEHHHPREAPL